MQHSLTIAAVDTAPDANEGFDDGMGVAWDGIVDVLNGVDMGMGMGMGSLMGPGVGTGETRSQLKQPSREGPARLGGPGDVVAGHGEKSWDQGRGTDDGLSGRGGYRGVSGDASGPDLHGGAWRDRRGGRERRVGIEGRGPDGVERRDGSRDRDRDRDRGGVPRRWERDQGEELERDRGRDQDREKDVGWGDDRVRRRVHDGSTEDRKGARWRDSAGSGPVREEERFVPGEDSDDDMGITDRDRQRSRGAGDRRGPRQARELERGVRTRERDRERGRDRDRERDRERDRGEDMRNQRGRERAQESPPHDLRDLLRRRRG
jgi:hypothetical protein